MHGHDRFGIRRDYGFDLLWIKAPRVFAHVDKDWLRAEIDNGRHRRDPIDVTKMTSSPGSIPSATSPICNAPVAPGSRDGMFDAQPAGEFSFEAVR